jgi:glutaminyl-peptide cyclotransferase
MRSRGRWRPDVKALVAAAAVVAGAALLFLQARAPEPQRAEPPRRVASYTYDVVGKYPHDPDAYTQGLLYRDGFLYESTGRNGSSSIRKVRLETGEVLQKHDVPEEYFGEGLVDWGTRLIQLTWTSNVAFVYDLATFEQIGTFPYAGEGWGLTHDRTDLIMSDGTPNLRRLDPATFTERSRFTVRDAGLSVDDLNELEYVNGSVYANVWLTDRIAVIDPATGDLTGWIDLAGLRPRAGPPADDVLNGIAYDAERNRLFVTGKLWPTLFEIRLRPK